MLNRNTRDIGWLLESKLSPENLAWDHAMEISASVYKRMKELDLKGKDLADRMGVTPARISRIVSGEQSMTLKTLARLEVALDIDMGSGFKNPTSTVKPSGSGGCCVIDFNTLVAVNQTSPMTVTLRDADEG